MQWTGVGNVVRAFHRVEQAMNQRVERSIGRDVMRPVERAVRRAAPRDTGALARSITTEVVGDRGARVRVRVGPSEAEADVGRFQEFGTSRHPAQPFLRPAWERHRRSIPLTYGAQARRRIERAV